MKTMIRNFTWATVLIFSRGGMAVQHDLLSEPWVTVKDKTTGLSADFPHHPLEMTFDVPFQNTPPTGQIHIYSVPTHKGLIGLTTYRSDTLTDGHLTKEKLLEFFDTVLVPHFFFNPAVFKDHQVFNYKPAEYEGLKGAEFQFSFLDHQFEKKLNGIGLIKDHTLYILFYLASNKDFDQKILDRYLNSFSIGF